MDRFCSKRTTSTSPAVPAHKEIHEICRNMIISLYKTHCNPMHEYEAEEDTAFFPGRINNQCSSRYIGNELLYHLYLSAFIFRLNFDVIPGSKITHLKY